MRLTNPLYKQLYKRVNATDEQCALAEWCRRFPDFPGEGAVQRKWAETRASRHGRPLTALHVLRMKNPVLKFGEPPRYLHASALTLDPHLISTLYIH